MRKTSFRMPTWSTLPAWVMMGAFSLSACEGGGGGDTEPGADGGSGGGEGPGETTPDAGAGGSATGGHGGDGGTGGWGGEVAADMRVGLTPDGFVAAPDAFVAAPDALVSTPDAFVAAPDALVSTPDASVPAPDAFAPAPDAFVPAPDAFVPAPDAFVPAPDAFVPAPDAFVPAPDAFVPAPDAALPPVEICPPGEAPVGEFAVDCGKVNVHRATGGEWAPDDDCRSGCNLADLAYCQAEFPGATGVVETAVSGENKPFVSAGCGEAFPGPGQRQFTCCAPAPAICPAGQHVVGQFATHCGMVNVHANAGGGEWSVDPDCSTGCDVADVGYCQRFWPESVGLVGVDVSPGPKGFTSGGCGESFAVPGQAQYACCAPDVILD